LKGDFGKNKISLVKQLASIVAANPSIKIENIGGVSDKYNKSLVEGQAAKLVNSIGKDRSFTLQEVVDILVTVDGSVFSDFRLLIAPSYILDSIPAGRGVKALPRYLEEILRKTKRKVVLMAPFWDMSTIIDLLKCIPRTENDVEIVLMLVITGKRRLNIENVAHEIMLICPFGRIRIYLHQANIKSALNYPHAKCLVVDSTYGYLGSANFTGQGMEGHFELGVSLTQDDVTTLNDILQYLSVQSGLFKLAWDSDL